MAPKQREISLPPPPASPPPMVYENHEPWLTSQNFTHSKAVENEKPWLEKDYSIANKANLLLGGDFGGITHDILHKVEWTDRHGSRKQNFHSHIPFPPFQIATKPLQAPEELSPKTDGPVLEVITPIFGGAPLETSSDPRLIDLKDIAIDFVGKTKIVLHSSLLLEAIRSIVWYYPGYNFTSEPITFTEPYPVLMHHLQDLRALHTRTWKAPNIQSDIEQKDTHYHLRLLLETLEPAIYRHITPAETRISRPRPTITFDELWYIFKPGADIYVSWAEDFKDTVFTAVVQATRIKESESRYAKPTFEIDIWVIESEGTMVGRTGDTRHIKWFEGEREITSLEHYPAVFWDRQDGGKRRQAVVERGHTHYKLIRAGPQQMRYDGRPYSSRRETVSCWVPSEGLETY